MKLITTLLLILSANTFANDIDISFGCFDCKKVNTSKYEKPVEKYENSKNKEKSIQISGEFTFRVEKIKEK